MSRIWMKIRGCESAKSEIRSTKSETTSNDQRRNDRNRWGRHSCLPFPLLILNLFRASCFRFRASRASRASCFRFRASHEYALARFFADALDEGFVKGFGHRAAAASGDGAAIPGADPRELARRAGDEQLVGRSGFGFAKGALREADAELFGEG